MSTRVNHNENKNTYTITYTFADGTTSVVEVSEEIGNVIIGFNRKEDSADRRHRRHDCSLEAYNVGDDLVASDEDIATDFIEKQDREQLYAAIQKLKPNQQDLISKLFFEGISQDEYARINGITKGAVSQRKEVAIKKLKLFLKKT